MENKFNLDKFDYTKIKELSYTDLEILASEIRQFIINKLSNNSGHLSSNLGAIELEIALILAYDIEKDKILFDISHQTYPYKILTGRGYLFDNLRKKEGLHGLMNYNESKYDNLESGHAGISIASLLGILISKYENDSVCVIGDAALSNGMALESLNLISYYNYNCLIIINNNNMSISKNVGSISNILANSKNASNFFKLLGYKYFYCRNGNNIKDVYESIITAKNNIGPTILQIDTIKGYGIKDIENDNIGYYHSISNSKKYSISEFVCDMFIDFNKTYHTHLLIPAMGYNTYFYKFEEKYPDRYTDLGISEEAMASASSFLSKYSNKKVFLSYYSTFSQRAFDQILNDISRNNFDVKILLDRSNIISNEDQTHQGIYDMRMFNSMPNCQILIPYDLYDYYDLMKYMFNNKGFMVYRYPKMDLYFDSSIKYEPLDIKISWREILKGRKLNIITYGYSVEYIKNIIVDNNLSINLYNARFVIPYDENMLHEIFKNNLNILVYEESYSILYEEILKFKEKHNYKNKIYQLNLNNKVVDTASYDEILNEFKISKKDIIKIYNEQIR